MIWYFGPTTLPAEGEHAEFWSLVPAILTLALVFLTRDVIISLLLGIIAAGLVSGQLNVLDAYILPAVGTRSYALILVVYLWALGGLIGIWTRTGGAVEFANWASQRFVRGPKSSMVFAWVMSMVFHQGGTVSTILTGTTVRPVTDRFRISHEELTYIVDSTASPGATVIPFNAWPLYIGGLLVGTTPFFPTEQEAVTFFFRALPLNFYGLIAVVSTLLFAMGLLPWVGGKMKRAIRRARETGQLDAPDAQTLVSDELTTTRVPEGYRPGLEDFLVPMLLLLSVAIVPYFITGEVRIGEAFGLAVITAFVLAIFKGMSVRDAMDGFIDGCKGVTVGAIILGLAVTLGYVSGELNTAGFIVESIGEQVPRVALPGILMVVCVVVAFSIGTSWGTYAVVFPLAMPLAYIVDPSLTYHMLCFGAVVGGSICGDQCSPISDTTILSALACGGDVMDHVTTQLPLAAAVAGIATVLATLVAFIT